MSKYVVIWKNEDSKISTYWSTCSTKLRWETPEEALKWAEERNLVDPVAVLEEELLENWWKKTFGSVLKSSKKF